jgi:hypothetical protein
MALCVNPVYAELSLNPGTRDDEIPLSGEQQQGKIDKTHQVASTLLLSGADWIDSFFDDDRYVLEENKTRAKLRLSFGYSQFDEFEFSPQVKLRLKLPRLSKKALLIISSSDDDDFDADQNPISENPRNDDSELSDLSAGLRYLLKRGQQYHISTTFGASFSYLFAGLRYRYEHDFGHWQGRFTDTLRYYTDDGWENRVAVDMERRFSKRWFFRTTASLDWYENEDGLPHALTFQLYQVFNRAQAVLYEIGSYFDTEPSHKLTDLQLRLRYRQRLFRDWLIFEIAPQIGFPEEHENNADPGIILRLEADFGYLATRNPFQSVFGF